MTRAGPLARRTARGSRSRRRGGGQEEEFALPAHPVKCKSERTLTASLLSSPADLRLRPCRATEINAAECAKRRRAYRGHGMRQFLPSPGYGPLGRGRAEGPPRMHMRLQLHFAIRPRCATVIDHAYVRKLTCVAVSFRRHEESRRNLRVHVPSYTSMIHGMHKLRGHVTARR